MAQITIQDANTSCHIYEALPTTNFSEQYLLVRPTTDKNSRALLRFDFSALPAGATITNATLSAYQYLSESTTGRTLDACEVTETGWVATQATWNVYATGSTWVVLGGDFTAVNKDSTLVAGADNAWVNWNVTTLAQHFQSTHSEIANFIIKEQTEDSGATEIGTYFRSNWYGADTTLRPKLVIDYSTGTAYTMAVDTGTLTLTGNAVAFNADVAPWDDTFDDNSLDTTKWVESTNADSLVAEQNQRLELISNAGVSGFVRSANAFVPKNNQMILKVVQHCTDGGFKFCPTVVANHMWDVYSENDWYNFQLIAGGVLSPNKKKAGVASQVGGDSPALTAPYWMRIRVDNSTIYFDYVDNQAAKPTESQWINISSEPFDIGTGINQQQYVYITAYNTPTTGELQVDNFQFSNMLTMTAETGSFALNGFSAGLSKGYHMACDTGAFVLTGIDVALSRGWTMVANAGAFVLTGVDATFHRAINMACAVGEFILTGIDVVLRRTGVQWYNQSQNSITPVNTTKNTINPTNSAKNSTSWTNSTKS